MIHAYIDTSLLLLLSLLWLTLSRFLSLLISSSLLSSCVERYKMSNYYKEKTKLKGSLTYT